MSTAVILQILAGLGGIVSIWLREYYSPQKTAAREETKRYEEGQKIREEVHSGDAVAVGGRIDRLCSDEADHPSGGSGGTDEERVRAGLVALGIGVGKDPGKSDEVR